ncbi:MAG: hypothetical protein AAGH41_13030 [Pseudomonadota bacterium]
MSWLGITTAAALTAFWLENTLRRMERAKGTERADCEQRANAAVTAGDAFRDALRRIIAYYEDPEITVFPEHRSVFLATWRRTLTRLEAFEDEMDERFPDLQWDSIKAKDRFREDRQTIQNFRATALSGVESLFWHWALGILHVSGWKTKDRIAEMGWSGDIPRDLQAANQLLTVYEQDIRAVLQYLAKSVAPYSISGEAADGRPLMTRSDHAFRRGFVGTVPDARRREK